MAMGSTVLRCKSIFTWTAGGLSVTVATMDKKITIDRGLEITPADLKPYDNNARTHSDKQVQQIMDSVNEFTFTNAILVDENNMVLAGHGRLMAANRLNMATVPVDRIHGLTEAQKKAYVLADNKMALNAGWDEKLLAAEFGELTDMGFDLALTGFSPGEIKGLEQAAAFNDGEDRAGNMAKQYLAPPFSVLDTKQGHWRDRKKAWAKRICDQGESRQHTLAGEGSLVAGINSGVSILDGALAETMCHWFAKPGMHAFDPFAGDSVFGYVACSMGLTFTGIELRQEQVDLNQSRLDKDSLSGRYVCDTSENLHKYIEAESMDFMFSCPPYADLEVYSDDPKDLSTMDTQDFFALYDKILASTYSRLKPNRFAVIVTSEVRGKGGEYIGLVPGTIRTMEQAGYKFYNEIILLNSIGTLPLRAGKSMQATRKVGRCHQNVLVFYKGDIDQIKANYGDMALPDMKQFVEEEDDGCA